MKTINKIIKNSFPSLLIFSALFVIFNLNFSVVDAGLLNEASTLVERTNQHAGLATGDLTVIIGSIIKYALGFLGTAFLILIIYGGFLWMTAGGNEEQVAKAKKVITNSAIGLLVVILSYAISLFIINVIRQAQLPPV